MRRAATAPVDGTDAAADRPYSPSMRAGDLVAVSGQCGYLTGRILADGLEAQIEQAFRNLEQALAAHGATLADVLSADVYLAREEDFANMNAVFVQHFSAPRPARTAVTAGLRPTVLIENSALAVLTDEAGSDGDATHE